MKAILKFDLDNAEDRVEHLKCVNATNMASFIWELKHNFWRQWKHDETDFTLDEYKEALHELMRKHSIDIDALIE